MDIIVGIHSIVEAIRNKRRFEKHLFMTDEARSLLSKELGRNLNDDDRVEVTLLSAHALQEKAKELFRAKKCEYMRVPSNILLTATSIEKKDINWLYDKIIAGEVKRMIALDQVSDAHNGAAILRTAAFYNVDCLIVGTKGSFGESPSFFRICSGGSEWVETVKVGSLSKCLSKLRKCGVRVLGLSEHAEESLNKSSDSPATCLVLGAEQVGLSNAVKRQIDECVCLSGEGKIKSLNVSVASAIAMDRVFG